MTRPTLTVVIPIYNEKRTVGDLLRLVAADSYPHPEEEVVVVDDANRDSTAAELRAFDRMPGFTLHPENRGKAVRTGLAVALGRVSPDPGCRLRVRPPGIPQHGLA